MVGCFDDGDDDVGDDDDDERRRSRGRNKIDHFKDMFDLVVILFFKWSLDVKQIMF